MILRKNQVEPRCAALDLWSLCLQRTVAWLQCRDDEQFDLAAREGAYNGLHMGLYTVKNY